MEKIKKAGPGRSIGLLAASNGDWKNSNETGPRFAVECVVETSSFLGGSTRSHGHFTLQNLRDSIYYVQRSSREEMRGSLSSSNCPLFLGNWCRVFNGFFTTISGHFYGNCIDFIWSISSIFDMEHIIMMTCTTWYEASYSGKLFLFQYQSIIKP